MKTILSSDYFLSRIVRILGEIGFVPGCLILLVLMTMSSFASAHHLPNSIKDHKSFDPTTSFELTIRAYDSTISELTPGLDKEHPHGGSISFLTSLSIPKCHPDEGRISFPTSLSIPKCHPDEGRISFYPITGTIYDAGGGIPGVVIKIKGTNIFTITDEFGQFQIDAQKGDILIISYPDYETIEVPITEQTEINLELFPAITQLEEAVINAGYYTVKDKERTGSIYKVTAKEIENQPVNNVLDALQGRVPGLDITPTTGLAGGGYTVRIRGQNSISAGNDPLYIIDGVPFDMGSLGSQNISGTIMPSGSINPLNSLDPKMIESIEILKDADATSIYGSRGANGVILIKTKNSNKGKTKFIVDISSSYSVVTKFLDLLNTEQYIKMRENAIANDGYNELPQNAYDLNGVWDKNRYTNWQKLFIGNTSINNMARINFNGGNETTSFNVGTSFMKQSTVFPGNYNYKKYSSNLNLKHLSKNNKLQLVFSAIHGIDNNYLPATDLTFNSIVLPPNAPALHDEDGNLNWQDNSWNNPYAELESIYKNNTKSLITNAAIAYNLFKNWSIKTNFGYTDAIARETRSNPSTMFNPSWGVTSARSSFHVNEFSRSSWIIEPSLEGKITWGKSNVSFLVGTSLLEQNARQHIYYGRGYPNDNLLNSLMAADEVIAILDDYNQYRYNAVFSRINYSYDGKYIVNLTGRRDGSSRFGPNKKMANFGAIGAAWLVSKEDFIKNISWINFLKLRTSYGITGNDQIGNYQYLNTYSISNNQYDGHANLIPTRLFNPDYAWERNKKYELALEVAAFKNKISLEANYYFGISDNQLTGIPLPATTGFSSINANLNAVVENSGWEVSINSENLENKSVKWNTSFQLSIPKTQLKKFENLEGSTYSRRLQIGYPLNIYKMYEFIGVNPQTGLFEFKDFNGDGKISAEEDRGYIADLTPSFMGSLTNQLKYKNLSLDFTFQFVKKKGFNEFYNFMAGGYMSNQPISVLDYWQEGANNPSYQLLTTGDNYDALMAHAQFSSSSGVISDASFIRLKNLSLNYLIALEDDLRCNLYVQAQNLLTITKFKGGDPEQIPGFLPPMKTISFGIRVEF